MHFFFSNFEIREWEKGSELIQKIVKAVFSLDLTIQKVSKTTDFNFFYYLNCKELPYCIGDRHG